MTSNQVPAHKATIIAALEALDVERRQLDADGLAEMLSALTEIEGEVSRLADRVAEDQISR